MRSKSFFCAVSVVVLLSGCSASQTLNSKDQVAYWLKYKNDERGVILRSDQKFCAEQAADAAFNKTLDTVNTLALDISGKATANAESQVNLSRNVVQLAQKSQAVLMQRESMYRICELSLNGYIDPATTRELFSKTLDVSMTIALAEVANALHNGSQLNQPTPPSKPEEAAKPKPEETAKPKPEETAKSKPEETAKPKPEETTKPKQVDTAKPIEPPSPVQSPIEESTDSRIRNFLNRKIDAIK